MKYNEINQGDYVMLKKEAVSYAMSYATRPGDDLKIVEGYEKFLLSPQLITKKREQKILPFDGTEFIIADLFGAYSENIDYVCTRESHPELYL
jgi:hypothetical protein